MSKKTLWVALSLVLLLLIGFGALGGFGQEGEQQERFKLLIVDETVTFNSSIRVEVFARATKRTGLFDLSARIVQVDSSFVDPLRGEEPDKRYEVILIVPRGIDEGTVKQVWVVTNPPRQISSQLWQAVGLLKEIADGVLQGAATAVDVTEDLIPGYFATIFGREGWL